MKKVSKNVAQIMTATLGLGTIGVLTVSQPTVAHASESNASTFINQIGPAASEIAANNDLYASVMIAQAILESNYGDSALSANYYNLFGVKAHSSEASVTYQTSEYLNNQWTVQNGDFKHYSSYYASIADQAYILKNRSFGNGTYYYSGAWKSNTTSYADATAYLTGRYATDPGYGAKLNSIIAQFNLTRFDTGSVNTTTTTTQTTSTTTTTTTSTAGSHTVVSGDTLYSIATNHGTTVDQVKAWNGLSSNTIYVGQTLTFGA